MRLLSLSFVVIVLKDVIMLLLSVQSPLSSDVIYVCCPPGYYCGSPGREAVTAPCAPGWYCIRGAWSDKPTDDGYSGGADNGTAADCFCPNSTTGGQCQPGEFCPGGSDLPTPCTRGKWRLLGDA